MLKILSWNIRQGGGSRTKEIVEKIVGSQSQIVVLSEYRNNQNGESLVAALKKQGFVSFIHPPAPQNENSVLIASKIEAVGETYPNADERFANNIAVAKYSAFSIMGVYLPHKKKHNLFDFIINHVKDQLYIITGDFNTGKNHIDQVGNSFWYTAELDRLEKIDFQDAFRLKNGDVREYSWYSHGGNGFRYDHTYIHHNLAPIVKECYYEHEWRERGISDHSPMILCLG